MKKNIVIKLISFCIAAVLISVGFIVKTNQTTNKYKLEVENNYSRNLENLDAAVNNISVLLEKAQYVTTAKQLGMMASELISEAEIAKTSLSQLPCGEEELTILNRFLSQVGNYAMTASKSLLETAKFDEKYENTVSALLDTSKKVAKAIDDSDITYNNHNYWAKQLDNELNNNIDENSLASSLDELEENLTDYPTLIYDGPFSDHILEKEPLVIKNSEEISQDKALENASIATSTDQKALNFDGLDDGKIPCYRFSNANVNIGISKNGGYVVFMRKSRAIDTENLEYKKLLDKAKKYLQTLNYNNMIDTYYFTSEGITVINFAFLDGETTCYTDLIKVGVAVDNGEIVFFEANGYLTNHTERTFETPSYSSSEASKMVSNKLTINETSLTLIPVNSNEVRCFEFVCSNNEGQNILIYINATNLEEERILILLKSDGGSLTK